MSRRPAIDTEDRLGDPAIREMAAFWRALPAGPDGVPHRDSFDPADVPAHLLPNLFLASVGETAPRYRYRLVGTAITNFTGRDLTGLPIDESTYGEFADAAIFFFDQVVELRRPIGLKGNAYWVAGGEWMAVELIAMPLATDDAVVGRILGLYVRTHRPEDMAGVGPSRPFRNLNILTNPLA